MKGATELPKLTAWLRTAARTGEMPERVAIARRFGCSATHAARLLSWLEEDGVIRIDRTKPNRPKISVVAN
jgi:DNA-binding GntR family transcriptional regulator